MRVRRTFLLLAVLAALTACDIPKDSVVLRNNEGTLRFVRDEHGVDDVLLCNYNSCRKAPDNEYKTAAGLTIPVSNGAIHFVEHPTVTCNYAPKDNREHLDCEDRD